MTDFDQDDELLARLRAGDPARSLPPADPSRVARLLEDTMSNATDTDELTEARERGTHGRNPLTWLVAAAAVAIIAAVGAFGVLNHDSGTDKVPTATDEPSVTELTAPAAGSSGKCMVPNARILGAQTLAFDGTVQEVADGVVTLVPSHFYAGDVTDLVEVQAPAADLRALIGAVEFKVGGRYLVSATDGQVTVCGFSGPYTPDLAGLYTQAFPS
jgi:hypothetical protein